MVTFSVLMVSLDNEASIEASLLSVYQQAIPAEEVILIDRDSGDRSVEIAKDTARRIGKKLSVISLKAADSLSLALNKGIAISNGNYVAFMNATDIWKNNFLSVMKEHLKAHSHIGFIGAGKNIKALAPDKSKVEFILIRHLLYREVFHRSGIVIKRKVLESIGGFNENIHHAETLECWTRIVGDYFSVLVKEPLVTMADKETKHFSRPRLYQKEERIIYQSLRRTKKINRWEYATALTVWGVKNAGRLFSIRTQLLGATRTGEEEYGQSSIDSRSGANN